MAWLCVGFIVFGLVATDLASEVAQRVLDETPVSIAVPGSPNTALAYPVCVVKNDNDGPDFGACVQCVDYDEASDTYVDIALSLCAACEQSNEQGPGCRYGSGGGGGGGGFDWNGYLTQNCAAAGDGEPGWVAQVGADPSARIGIIISQCPDEVMLAMITNPSADVTHNQQQVDALSALLAAKASPTTTVPRSTTTVPRSTSTTIRSSTTAQSASSAEAATRAGEGGGSSSSSGRVVLFVVGGLLSVGGVSWLLLRRRK